MAGRVHRVVNIKRWSVVRRVYTVGRPLSKRRGEDSPRVSSGYLRALTSSPVEAQNWIFPLGGGGSRGRVRVGEERRVRILRLAVAEGGKRAVREGAAYRWTTASASTPSYEPRL